MVHDRKPIPYLAAILAGFFSLGMLHAEVTLYDSGPGVSGSGTAIGWYLGNQASSTQYSKAQSFTNTQGPATITSINVWLKQGSSSLAGSFNLSLFSATGTVGSTATPVLGSPLFSTTINTSTLSLDSTAREVTFDLSGLNWSLGSGSYFFAFDATAMTGNSSSENYFTLLYSSPELSGQNLAYSTDALSSWTAFAVGSNHPTAAGTVLASVPEPGTLLLLALSQGILAGGWLVWRFLPGTYAPTTVGP
jgi:hypothetical protein